MDRRTDRKQSQKESKVREGGGGGGGGEQKKTKKRRRNAARDRQRQNCLRGDMVVETKATLKVVRTGVKRVLIYSKIENATFCSLPWTRAVNFISKGTVFCSYVPATA